MKAVVAVDSFKGSMTSMQAGNAVKRGILSACPDAEVVVCPVADGGEGTTDALIEGLGGEKISLTVTGPYGDFVSCYYGWLSKQKTAVMEMASAAGITLVKERNPLRASTRGVGEMIADALKRGCRNFIIGIGGSATNDGGIGMLKALGYSFLDEKGQDVGEGAQALGKVMKIGGDKRNPLLEQAHFQIACDVTNPLCGVNGATYIFGPQKGVVEEQKQPLDEAMHHYAEVVEQHFHCDAMNQAGLEIPKEYCKLGRHSFEHGYRGMKELLELEDRPTGVILGNYNTMLGGIMALNESGLSCPQDVSLIGVDNLPMTQVLRPKLWLIVQPMETMCEKAVAMLLERVNGEQNGMPVKISFSTSVREGDSIRDLG